MQISFIRSLAALGALSGAVYLSSPSISALSPSISALSSRIISAVSPYFAALATPYMPINICTTLAVGCFAFAIPTVLIGVFGELFGRKESNSGINGSGMIAVLGIWFFGIPGAVCSLPYAVYQTGRLTLTASSLALGNPAATGTVALAVIAIACQLRLTNN